MQIAKACMWCKLTYFVYVSCGAERNIIMLKIIVVDINMQIFFYSLFFHLFKLLRQMCENVRYVFPVENFMLSSVRENERKFLLNKNQCK